MINNMDLPTLNNHHMNGNNKKADTLHDDVKSMFCAENMKIVPMSNVSIFYSMTK